MKKTDEIKSIGKWGRLHYDYLYKNKRTVINAMRMNGTLRAYLKQFDNDAQDTFEKLVKRRRKRRMLQKNTNPQTKSNGSAG